MNSTHNPVERFFSRKWAVALPLLALALFIFLVYYRTISGAFQLDDEVWIINNPVIRNLSNLPAMLWGQRGLTMASLALNYAVGGLDPRGYHLVNIFIHIINAILVYIFLAQTLSLAGMERGRAGLIAILSAALFSLHPVQTQAVTYVVQRMESLCALFSLLGLIVFIRGARSSSALKRYVYFAFTTLSYIAAFYSKEIAITLPLLILLHDIYFMSKGSFREVLKKWPLYAALGVFSIFFIVNTVAPLGGFSDVSEKSVMETAPAPVPTGEDNRYAGIPALKSLPTAGFGVTTTTPYEYFLTESNVLLYYYSLLVLPMNQNIDYDFPVSRGLFKRPEVHEGTRLTIPLPPPVVSIIIHASFLALAIILFFLSQRKSAPAKRCVSFFIIWFFVILLPTSSFIPIVDVIFEHRLYLASLGYALILTLLLEKALSCAGDRGSAPASSKKH